MKWDKEKLEGYNPGEIEAKWYDFWEKEGYFHQDPDSSREPYSIVMPPPNVTGQLHMGHALDNTLQDILIRFKRMSGYNVVWIPGTDHAGIAIALNNRFVDSVHLVTGRGNVLPWTIFVPVPFVKYSWLCMKRVLFTRVIVLRTGAPTAIRL